MLAIRLIAIYEVIRGIVRGIITRLAKNKAKFLTIEYIVNKAISIL